MKGERVKYSVLTSLRHKGKVLQVDVEREMVTLLGGNGDVIGSLSWDVVIDQVLAYRRIPVQKEVRVEPRISLTFRVRYNTPEGQQFESRAGGIGGGGLFIESSAPLAPGTELKVEFALPDRPSQKFETRAKVAWARSKPERYLLFPGMGIQFTDIDPEAQARLIDLVASLNRTRATA